MPVTKRKSTASKTKRAPKKAASNSGMSPSQKTIYGKLRKKGMSEKQAEAFSKHAARRKDSAKKVPKTTTKSAKSSKSATKSSKSRGRKRG